jgi:alkaline phosphatase
LKHQKCSIGVLGEKIAELGKKEGANFADAKKIINENFNMYFADDKNQPADALKLSADEAKQLADAFARQFPQGKYKKGSALTREIIRIFNRKCGLAWSSGNHTALPVLTTAYGTQAEIFKGFIDNTDISKKLKQAVR